MKSQREKGGDARRRNGRNAFGPLGALLLLLVGAYLIVTALLNPIDASDLKVLAGGFTLALSTFFFIYLLRPQSLLERKSEKFPHSKATVRLESRTADTRESISSNNYETTECLR